MKKNLTLISLIVLNIVGCSYNFSSDNYNNIEKPSSTNNTIVINDFNNLDTINVERLMTYTLESPSNSFRAESKVYLDGETIGSSWNENVGRFKLFPSKYEDGVHTLKIEHSFHSGSGSLADQAGVEILKKVEEFEFVVHRKTTLPPTITEAIIENGSITVKWDQLNDDDYEYAFLSIKFKRSENRIPLTQEMLNSGHFIDKTTVLYTGNSNTPYFDDYSKVTYSILLTNEYTDNYGGTKEITYDPSWFSPKIVFKGFESHIIKWPPHPLYENFENLEFSTPSISFLGTSNGGEYIINEPYVFGAKQITNVRPIANNGHRLFTFHDTELDESTFGLFDFDGLNSKGILYNPSTGKYYSLIVERYVGPGFELYVHEYSKDMEFLEKTYITQTENSKHNQVRFYLDPVNNDFYLDTNYSSYLLEKTSLNILKEARETVENNTKSILRSNIKFSYNYESDELTIINVDNNIIIYKGEAPGRFISRDGKYVLIGNSTEASIYEISNDQLIKVIDAAIGPSQIIINNQTMFYSVGNQVFIIDLNTKIEKSFEFGNYQKIIQFDPISQKLLVTGSDYAGIYNLDSEQLEVFPFDIGRSTPPGYYMRIENGRLFHSRGIYIDNY